MILRDAAKKLIPAKQRRQMRALLHQAGVPVYSDVERKVWERFEQVDWPKGHARAIYALTPPAELTNVGDQAQVVAIKRWLAKHYPDYPIVELDKDMVLQATDRIRKNIRPDDIIFLHSGGNLGDRGIWSETGRRTMISSFPDNKIVSLPQTIYFSDTDYGREQREISRGIYNAHRHLAVIGRDQVSAQLATELFPAAQTAVCPDFVLSLDIEDFPLKPDPADADKLLVCLRLDDESVFSPEERQDVATSLGKSVGSEITLFDTTLDIPIPPEAREKILVDTLSLVAGHKAVVTDRFHGVIFAVLCRKPTVVMRTVDHKLTSAIDWFADIPNVRFCEHPSKIKETLEAVMAMPVPDYPDFNALYFDRLPELIASVR